MESSPENKKFNPGYIIATLLVVGAIVFLYSVFRSPGSSTGISPNILYLTQPVYSINGVIEKVN